MNVVVDGPFALVEQEPDHVYTLFPYESPVGGYISDLPPEFDVLSNLKGVRIYCRSNRCTNRILRHHQPAPLVGVLIHVRESGDKLVMPSAGHQARSRRPVRGLTWRPGHEPRQTMDLPADFTCHRCGAKGVIRPQDN